MRVYSRRELAEQARLLASHHFCRRAADAAEALVGALKPRERQTTLEWSLENRIIRKDDGTRTKWRRERSEALIPVMEALDDPEVLEVILPKPSRIGGTMIAENFALKCLDTGPLWSIMWYLAGPTEVGSYADRVLAPMFEDHEAIAAKVGGGKSDDTKRFKRVGSQTFELMVMSKTTTTNRQAGFIVFDEPDSYSKDFRSNFLEQGRQRQSDLGTNRKIYACAHADIGWSGGIAAAWILSSQGIYIFRCPSCGTHGSPYPTKYWPDVPRFRLSYEAGPGLPVDRRIALARRTAVIACPHGCVLDEADRAAMIRAGRYLHKGQALDPDEGVTGEMEPTSTRGFWAHALMTTQVPLGDLAAALEGAKEHRERTGKSDKIKQVLVRTFGEVFEGAADLDGIDAKALRGRAGQTGDDGDADVLQKGQFPDAALFITAAVDVGKDKFDVSFRAWDRATRSWWIERFTIRQRVVDGRLADIRPRERVDDWDVLIDEVITRRFPLQSDPNRVMPVAQVTIDVSDGNVTWIGREFAARCIQRGHFWGKRKQPWAVVQLIQGSPNSKAPELPEKPRIEDSKGRRFSPGVQEWSLGVHKLKELSLERLAITDGGPGHCYFAAGIAADHYDEYFNEPLIDGTFVRQGPNESLDLFGYEEAARLMLKPDRKSIRWSQADLPAGQLWSPDMLPVWAQPIALQPEGGDLPAEAKGDVPKTTATNHIQRLAALNRRS